MFKRSPTEDSFVCMCAQFSLVDLVISMSFNAVYHIQAQTLAALASPCHVDARAMISLLTLRVHFGCYVSSQCTFAL